MSEGPIEDALRITLEDHRLSRGEKRSLAKVVEKVAGDEQRLAFARNFAFKLAHETLRSGGSPDVLQWLEEVIKVLHPTASTSAPRSSEAYFSPGDQCVARIVRLLDSTRKTADICVFTITDDRITDAILRLHRRNLRVRVISDNDKAEDRGSDIDTLERLGVPVRVDRSEYHMHHKYAVFDNRTLMTGSYNWTRGAAKYNEENFIVTSEPSLISEFRSNFESLWKNLG